MKTRRYAISPLIQVKLNSNLVYLFSLGTSFIISNLKIFLKKYRMVIDYEPTFPDIRVAFRKFKSRLEDDEELKEIFPKGIKHLQVSERRGAKNMKEILAPSVSAVNSADTEEGEHIEPSITRNTTSMVENDNGCYPCGKNCAYCTLVDKSKGNTFKSVTNEKGLRSGRKLIVRQRI